jgi:exodeoxyribonuclease VII small subunit
VGRTRDSGSADRDPPEELPFEKALERLEEIAERLETGDLELEGALSAFEEGVCLARRCAEQLREAERRIEVLSQDGDGWIERDFEPPEDEG